MNNLPDVEIDGDAWSAGNRDIIITQGTEQALCLKRQPLEIT